MLPVTKPFLPNLERYIGYLEGIYARERLTNNGPLVRELEARLSEYLGVEHVVLTANGTLALMVAYHALGLSGEVITSPFSFVATASSLVWSGLHPVYADIDPETFNIDPGAIEKALSGATSAICGVHVYGNPCDIAGIEALAEPNRLPVIYDASHAFGARIGDRSLLDYGDISVLSFHATKLFHTAEGGALILQDAALASAARELLNFGFSQDGAIARVGINAKMNELEAAMGVCVLDDIDFILDERRKIAEFYESALTPEIQYQGRLPAVVRNYAYFPVVFKTSRQRDLVQKRLLAKGIETRIYFTPSLDTVEVLAGRSNGCPASWSLTERVLCLPIFPGIEPAALKVIVDEVNGSMTSVSGQP
jgi:dTDP-4-amino-4,6-dideoxygalactose transaminase